MASQTANVRFGEVLADRYQLGDTIGQGGQSVVYRARDMRQGDEVAVKVLNEKAARDADFRERMLREAFAMASLQGTSAVRVLDQTQTRDGALCLVMELLQGEELEDRLRTLEAGGTRMQLAELVQILHPVVHTVDLAHDRGIIHRDLKPGNIFLVDAARGGGVRLLDFGFAKFEQLISFTAAGTIAGSKSYIAPEAWRGQSVDRRIDVYALGAIIFRALAGQPPFHYEDLTEILRAVTTAPRPSLRSFRPELPPAVDDWVGQVLAIEPVERFVRAGAMWAAFRGCIGL